MPSPIGSLSTTRYITFHLAKSGPEDGRTASSYVPALLTWAKLNGLIELPITLAMIEAAEAEDLKWSNHDYERGHDILDDLIATIERRLPGEVHLRKSDRYIAVSVAATF